MTIEKDDVVLVEHTDVGEINNNKSTDETMMPTFISDDENEDLVDDEKKKTSSAEEIRAEPLQIVSIGNEEDKFAFTFHEEKLNSIMRKIPACWKVSVVSVVGAFRTGKSFLLTWFLAYLKEIQKSGSVDLVDSDGKRWFEKIESIQNDAFHWRGGSDRDTTGIWMWSEPHFVKKGNEEMAILLVDSQGMFDNETTMSLTASIFGLSTLLSSYQIYNVDKRIQEDNLQQLALFSEYARLAVEDESSSQLDNKNVDQKPFQRIEFLVRDWQHFDDVEEDNYDQMEELMNKYIGKVIAEREAKDLQETREQILSCFENITCFGLSHPGLNVIKKTFQGEVAKMDETFLNLLDRYCKRVFSADNLTPKVIQGREVTAIELGTYIKAYAEMFATGAKFPEASTMLEATAYANNSNAVNLAVSQYKDCMNRISGPSCTNYIKKKELEDDHRILLNKVMVSFNSIATFGSKQGIEEARKSVIGTISNEFEVYSSLNDGRNPLAGMETYIIPLMLAITSYILRAIADGTCSSYSQTCRNTSEFLSHVYAVVIFFMIIVGTTKAQQFKESFGRLKGAFQLIFSDNSGGKKQKVD